jgi:hypothetical protein
MSKPLITATGFSVSYFVELLVLGIGALKEAAGEVFPTLRNCSCSLGRLLLNTKKKIQI